MDYKLQAEIIAEAILEAYDTGDTDHQIYKKGNSYYIDEVGLPTKWANEAQGFTEIMGLSLYGKPKPDKTQLTNYLYRSFKFVDEAKGRKR